MSEDLNFRDLSKAQRKLLAALFLRIREESAASIDAALTVDCKSRQTARNLGAKGFVVVDPDFEWRRAHVRFTRAGFDATARALSAPGQRARAISR